MRQNTLKMAIILGIAISACQHKPQSEATTTKTIEAKVTPPTQTIATSKKVGMGCQYISYEGSAKIISITPAPKTENNCPNNPKKITFVFTPKDIASSQKYKFKKVKNTATLTINSGLNPSQKFLDAHKIAVGKVFNCSRKEIVKGTCTPVTFKFPGIDLFPTNGCN